ncbi:MAG TPA: alpha/beta fold hydrolase, partial [Thermodesulfobacteriota bacterium]|nr:alpha/beta fold hydrolase [Thermodesulfobacteriota bacterium]
DNRGAGNTDKPDSEYTIEIMADDAAGLLRTLGTGPVHVLGISLGGFIAQELALRHPDLVRSLVLVSTNSGRGSRTMRNSPHLNGLLKLWGILPGSFEMTGKASAPLGIEYGLTREEKIRYGLSLAFTPEYYKNNPEEIERIVRWRLESPQPGYAWSRQFTAGTHFDSSGRAEEISVPALVINGSDDRIVSPESARELAEKIPGARYAEMEGTGHLLFIERSEEFNETVVDFLDGVGTDDRTNSGSQDNNGWWQKIVSLISVGNGRKGNHLKN